MRKLTLLLTLIALLVISTAVVYGGFQWDEGSPEIGEGYYLHWTVTADNPPDGWDPEDSWDWAGKVELDGDRTEVEARVWVADYDEDAFACTLEVTLTYGEDWDDEGLAVETGSCREVELEWKSSQ